MIQALDALTRGDALTFRDFWMDRLRAEGLSPRSANKSLGCLSHIVKVVSDALRLGINNPFSGLRIPDEQKKDRLPFAPSYVVETLLPGLAPLNAQARGVVLAMADTGARVNEICGLAPEDIYLDAPVPYIHIKPNAYALLRRPPARGRFPL